MTLLPILTPNAALALLGLPRYVLGAFPLFLIVGRLLSRSRLALYFCSSSAAAWVWG